MDDHRPQGMAAARAAPDRQSGGRWSARAMWVVAGLSCGACSCGGDSASNPDTAGNERTQTAVQAARQDPMTDSRFQTARNRMVETQIEARGVRNPRVIAAMRSVPRHAFVRRDLEPEAYDDNPLPIDAGQTISQPYVVALMTELADVAPGERVLEVGTGCGYQAAVLAEIGAEVFSIEIVDVLASSARSRLAELGYRVEVRHGDGYRGWPEHAPFDAILVTAAPPEVPAPLTEQLATGGRLIVPVGRDFQQLTVITKTEQGLVRREVLPVRFVPMTGEAQQP